MSMEKNALFDFDALELDDVEDDPCSIQSSPRSALIALSALDGENALSHRAVACAGNMSGERQGLQDDMASAVTPNTCIVLSSVSPVDGHHRGEGSTLSSTGPPLVCRAECALNIDDIDDGPQMEAPTYLHGTCSNTDSKVSGSLRSIAPAHNACGQVLITCNVVAVPHALVHVSPDAGAEVLGVLGTGNLVGILELHGAWGRHRFVPDGRDCHQVLGWSCMWDTVLGYRIQPVPTLLGHIPAGASSIAKAELAELAEDSAPAELSHSTDAMSGYEQAVVKELCLKGCSFEQLLDFIKQHGPDGEHDITEETTTQEVVTNLVVPLTKERGCCFMDWCGISHKAETFVSHWWGDKFLAFARAIAQDAGQQRSFYKRDYTCEQLARTFWICIFAVNQHTSTCHLGTPPCDCGRPKYSPDEAFCETDKFSCVMSYMRRCLVVVDPKLKALGRAWVLGELGEVLANHRQLTAVVVCAEDTGYMPEVSEHLATLASAVASFPADRALIITRARQCFGTLEAFDRAACAKLAAEVLSLRVFRFADSGDFRMVIDEARRAPWLVQLADICRSGKSLLHYAACCDNDADAVCNLLALHAPVNHSDSNGRTPLHDAARYGRAGAAEVLIGSRANVGSHDKSEGESPLHLAAKHGHQELVRLLVSGYARVDEMDDSGRRPLQVAVGESRLLAVELLLAAKAEVGETHRDASGYSALDYAVASRCAKAVTMLLAYHAHPNAVDHNGTTSLFRAARNGEEDVVAALLAGRADTDAHGPTGIGPAQVAAMFDHMVLVDMLSS